MHLSVTRLRLAPPSVPFINQLLNTRIRPSCNRRACMVVTACGSPRPPCSARFVPACSEFHQHDIPPHLRALCGPSPSPSSSLSLSLLLLLSLSSHHTSRTPRLRFDACLLPPDANPYTAPTFPPVVMQCQWMGCRGSTLLPAACTARTARSPS